MTTEFSRMQSVAAVGPDGLARTLDANDAERAALARRFGVRRLDSLSAGFDLRHERQGLAVRGTVRATGQQNCSITGDPVDFALAEPVNCLYVADPEETAQLLDPEDPADLDQLSEQVDLGELAAQTFALGLDPYPRRPGLPDEKLERTVGEAASPFAVLARLKDRG